MATVMKLNGNKLTRLQSLEKEIGCYLVAFEPVTKPATISDSQLLKLKSLEKDMEAIIVAYERK